MRAHHAHARAQKNAWRKRAHEGRERREGEKAGRERMQGRREGREGKNAGRRERRKEADLEPIAAACRMRRDGTRHLL